jgi:Ca2+-binding RTX toxin-like protein
VDLDASANTITFNIAADNNDLALGGGSDDYTIALNGQFTSVYDSSGTTDRVIINTSTGGTTAFTGLNFYRYEDNIEFTGVSNSGNAHVVIRDHYISDVERFRFDDGATYHGFTFGSADYTIDTNNTGSGANEIIAGSNDTITGGGGNDLLFGGAGNDSISATSGTNLLVGGAGNDTIAGGTGNDYFIGGAGNDSMTGGGGVDVFKWELADVGTAGAPATDTISGFDTVASSDKLDLRDILLGESATGTALDNYLHFEFSGGNTILHVSTTGAFGDNNAVGAPNSTITSNEVQQIVFTGVDLVGGATTDQQVIQNLLDNNKLITD